MDTQNKAPLGFAVIPSHCKVEHSSYVNFLQDSKVLKTQAEDMAWSNIEGM
jgi:hypothetical protein